MIFLFFYHLIPIFIQLDNISSDALLDITQQVIESLIESATNADMLVIYQFHIHQQSIFILV